MAKFLPDRTKNAIQARALYCGLTAPGPSKRTSGWDTEAVELLQQLYPTGGWQAVQKLLPNKSEKAIRRKANNLGLKVNKERIC